MTQRHQGPDFICIGAQKAGTGWLFDQLDVHPEFWMPPIKELHFFSGRMKRKFAIRHEAVLQRATTDLPGLNRERAAINRRPLDDRDIAFYKALHRACTADEPTIEQYNAMFQPRGECISGDITPAYSGVPEATVRRVADACPRAKFLYLARDPVERAWSQYTMWYRNNRIERDCALELESLQAFLGGKSAAKRSFPSRTVTTWSRHVPAERFRVFFFDEIRNNPAELRTAILRYLGADSTHGSSTITPEYNRLATELKLDMPPHLRSYLVEYFHDELGWCAATLGGAAKGWIRKYEALAGASVGAR